MSKSTRITIIFVLIFVVGVLSFVAAINQSLNNNSSASFTGDTSSISN